MVLSTTSASFDSVTRSGVLSDITSLRGCSAIMIHRCNWSRLNFTILGGTRKRMVAANFGKHALLLDCTESVTSRLDRSVEKLPIYISWRSVLRFTEESFNVSMRMVILPIESSPEACTKGCLGVLRALGPHRQRRNASTNSISNLCRAGAAMVS